MIVLQVGPLPVGSISQHGLTVRHSSSRRLAHRAKSYPHLAAESGQPSTRSPAKMRAMTWPPVCVASSSIGLRDDGSAHAHRRQSRTAPPRRWAFRPVAWRTGAPIMTTVGEICRIRQLPLTNNRSLTADASVDGGRCPLPCLVTSIVPSAFQFLR